MAKTVTKFDEYSQRVYVEVTCPAAGAGNTIEPIPSSFTDRDPVGALIRKWEVHVSAGQNINHLAFMSAGADVCYFGLSFAGVVPATNIFEPQDVGYIDSFRLEADIIATAAGLITKNLMYPLTRGFTDLKEGGFLVHPAVLYAWIGAEDNVSAGGVDFTFIVWYDLISLTDKLYQELWQSQIMRGSIG